MAQPRFAMLPPRTLRSASLRHRSTLLRSAVARRWCALPLLANAMHCPCHAGLRCALPSLCNACQCPCHAVVAAQSHRTSPPCRRIGSHCHAPASQRPAIAARTAPCSCGSMRRPAPQPRSCASPPPCCAFDALPSRINALLSDALAVRRNPQPLLCQSSPLLCHAAASRRGAVPSHAAALLRSAAAALARAFPCPSWAVHCPCWPAHCFSVAVPAIAPPSQCFATYCLRGSVPRLSLPTPRLALPPLRLALPRFAAASPSLAIALLRRATPWQLEAKPQHRTVPPIGATPSQRSPEHSRRRASYAIPQPFPASLFLSLATLVSATALLCCAIAQRRLAIAAQGVSVPSLRCAFGSFAVARPSAVGRRQSSRGVATP